MLISLYQKAEYQKGRERGTSEDHRHNRGRILLKVQDIKIGSNLCREMIEKKSLKNLLENKVLIKLIDPSEGLICRQNRAQKGERQVSQTWERF